jgi:hypothetical protein
MNHSHVRAPCPAEPVVCHGCLIVFRLLACKYWSTARAQPVLNDCPAFAACLASTARSKASKQNSSQPWTGGAYRYEFNNIRKWHMQIQRDELQRPDANTPPADKEIQQHIWAIYDYIADGKDESMPEWVVKVSCKYPCHQHSC